MDLIFLVLIFESLLFIFNVGLLILLLFVFVKLFIGILLIIINGWFKFVIEFVL